jgi:PAS domain S-box-containing protein
MVQFRGEGADEPKRCFAHGLFKEYGFLDALDELVLILDGGLIVLYANRPFLEKTGYLQAELIGRPIEDLLPESDRRRCRAALDEAQGTVGGCHGLEHGLILKNGGTESFRTTAVPETVPGEQPLVMLRLKCVSDMLRDKESLEVVRALYLAIAEQANETFIMHDGTGKILDVNRFACRKLGYTREELLSMHIQKIDAIWRSENLKSDGLR